MSKFIENFKARVVKHWITTVKGITYGVLTWLLYSKHISVAEWTMGVGTILTLNSIFLQKDPDKVQTKPEHKP